MSAALTLAHHHQSRFDCETRRTRTKTRPRTHRRRGTRSSSRVFSVFRLCTCARVRCVTKRAHNPASLPRVASARDIYCSPVPSLLRDLASRLVTTRGQRRRRRRRLRAFVSLLIRLWRPRRITHTVARVNGINKFACAVNHRRSKAVCAKCESAYVCERLNVIVLNISTASI